MATPSGRVYLCANAIVDRNYNHTIDFKNPGEQRAYWGSLIKYSADKSVYTYIRRTREYITVDYPLNKLQDINYLFYQAEEDGKIYYCFVTQKEYLNDNTSYIYFEVDVLQTRMFEYQVKPSYVLQEHCDRWDADHKPIYSRTEEGLDYGSEYTVESGYRALEGSSVLWYLAICKPHNNLVSDGHNGLEPTSIGGISNPYVYYLLPDTLIRNLDTYTFNYNNEKRSTSEIIAPEHKTIQVNGLITFSKDMGDSELGNFVHQIVRMNYCPFKQIEMNIAVEGINENITIDAIEDSGDRSYFKYATINGHNYIRLYDIDVKSLRTDLAEMGIFEGIESAMPTAEQWEEIKANPYTTERDKRFESKLLTHPYRYNLLTDWKSQPIVIKNEYIGGDKIKLKQVQAIGPNAPARYYIDNYKKDPEGRASSLTQLIQDDYPVINDQYYSFMLSNRNQLQADKTNAILSSVANMSKSAVGGALFGGGLGALSGAISSGLDSAIGIQNLVRSQNAKQQDLKNLPDSIVNSNDGSMIIQDNNACISFYRMKICCEFEELLADTFNMTGYTVKRVKMPNLRTRARFNYVKTVGANIIGSFDQNDLNKIKAIFDNGVTFWHWNENPEHFKPYDYSIENIETKLL